jgi:hypothetical protein
MIWHALVQVLVKSNADASVGVHCTLLSAFGYTRAAAACKLSPKAMHMFRPACVTCINSMTKLVTNFFALSGRQVSCHHQQPVACLLVCVMCSGRWPPTGPKGQPPAHCSYFVLECFNGAANGAGGYVHSNTMYKVAVTVAPSPTVPALQHVK